MPYILSVLFIIVVYGTILLFDQLYMDDNSKWSNIKFNLSITIFTSCIYFITLLSIYYFESMDVPDQEYRQRYECGKYFTPVPLN